MIAHFAFWVILLWGWATQELTARGVAVFLAVWIGGRIALPSLGYGDGLFTPYVAALDVALVLIL